MKQPHELYRVLRQIFTEQRYGILATNGEQYPHTTVVCYAAADNLSTLLFVTPRPSRKFQFLLAWPHASLFVDNRSDDSKALHQAYGIETRGIASQVEDSQWAAYRSVYLAKYPELRSFIDAESNALKALFRQVMSITRAVRAALTIRSRKVQ